MMSLPIQVDAYSGPTASNWPLRFRLDGETYHLEVHDRWEERNTDCFFVRTKDDKGYIIRYDKLQNEWTLHSGCDGDELLLAKIPVEIITVDPPTIRKAESRIVSCEQCAPRAEIPFDWVIEVVIGKDGRFEFIMAEPALCPNCRAVITERTLVEPQGGIETEAQMHQS